MARPLRIEFPGAWYHVTSRGNESKSLFTDDQDREKFLEILGANLETYRVQMHGYVLMDNHFHLLLMTPAGNLATFMQRLNTAYTIYCNRRHRRAGRLFQGRYKAILIDAESHLAELSRYLHLNPVRIRKVSKQEIPLKKKLLSSYRWSSYGGYTSVRRRDSFVTYEVVLAALGVKDDLRGRRKYQEFVLAGVARDMNITYWKDVRGQAILGSDAFIEWVRDKFLKDSDGKKAEEKAYRSFGELLPAVALDSVAEVVGEEFGVEWERLMKKRSRQRQARRFFLGLCYDLFGGRQSLSAIGARLGPVSAAALCRNRKVLRDELRKDRKLAQKYEYILKELQLYLIIKL